MSVDPAASEYPSLSPYAYVANNPVRFTDPTGMWIEDENGALIAEKNDDALSLSEHLDIDLEEANAMFSNLDNWDGGNNTTGITDVDGHTLSTTGNPNTLVAASFGLHLSIGRGFGVEYGGIEDGENSMAFLTLKSLHGFDASVFAEVSRISSITGNRISPKDTAGPGSEISMGLFAYSYTGGGDNYLTGSNSLNPDLYRVNSHSLGIGLDIARTDASTYTWVFKPAKLPQYYKHKMGGL